MSSVQNMSWGGSRPISNARHSGSPPPGGCYPSGRYGRNDDGGYHQSYHGNNGQDHQSYHGNNGQKEIEKMSHRPSATSEEYSGPGGNSKVSIHNMIERQSWETRMGLANSFDPALRGYHISRDMSDRQKRRKRSMSSGSYRGRSHSQDYDEKGSRGHQRNRHDSRPQGSRRDRRSRNRTRSRDRSRSISRPRSPSRSRSRSRSRSISRSRRSCSPRRYSPRNRYPPRDSPHDHDYDDHKPKGDRYKKSNRDYRRNHYENRHHDEDRHHDENRHHDHSNRYGSPPRHQNHHRPPYRSATTGAPNRPPSPPWEEVRNKRSRNRSQPTKKPYHPRENNEPPIPVIKFISPNQESLKFEPFMLLLVGLPGSGKSTFAKLLATGKPWKYVRVSQDVLGSRPECEHLTRKILSEGKCPVIDRCNFDPTQRKHFLNIAKEFNVPVDSVVFTYSMEVCIGRCEKRGDTHESIRPSEAREVVAKMIRDFCPPLPNRINAEKFRNLRNVTEVQMVNDIVLEYLSSLY